MPKHLSKDIKQKIIAKHEQGLRTPVIAEHFMISERSVYRTIHQYKYGEDLTPKTKNCGKQPSYSDKQKQIIIDLINEKPDITLLGLINAAGLNMTESTMSRIVKKLGYKRKNGYYK